MPGTSSPFGLSTLQLQSDGLDVALAAAHVALGGVVAFDRFEDDGAFDGLALRQAHLEPVANSDEAAFRLGSGRAHPGIVEVDDGNDRRAGLTTSPWRAARTETVPLTGA